MFIETFWLFNSSTTNAPLLHLLKTSEHLVFSNVLRGYKSGALVEDGLITLPLFCFKNVLKMFIKKIKQDSSTIAFFLC